MGLLWSAFSGLLGSNSPERKILLLGLDAAGKTSLLYRLKLAESVHTIPTVGFNVENVQYKNLTFVIWDVGGQEGIRALWKHYFEGTSALIFIVDSADPDRFSEAKEELGRLSRDEKLKQVPLLVFANKCDMEQSVGSEEIARKLGLDYSTLSHEVGSVNMEKNNSDVKERKWNIFRSCCLNGEGIYDGLNWLSNQMKE